MQSGRFVQFPPSSPHAEQGRQERLEGRGGEGVEPLGGPFLPATRWREAFGVKLGHGRTRGDSSLRGRILRADCQPFSSVLRLGFEFASLRGGGTVSRSIRRAGPRDRSSANCARSAVVSWSSRASTFVRRSRASPRAAKRTTGRGPARRSRISNGTFDPSSASPTTGPFSREASRSLSCLDARRRRQVDNAGWPAPSLDQSLGPPRTNPENLGIVRL